MSAAELKAAWGLLSRGDAQGAHVQLADLIRRQPRLAEAHRLMGMAYRVLGSPTEADASFRAAIAADRKAPEHHAEYAAFLEAQGRIKEAERAFRQALSLNRRFAPAASGLAMLLIDQGRADEAVRVTTPLAVDPNAGIALRAVHGRAQQESCRFQEAEATFRAILDKVPQNAQAHTDLAELVWMRTGDAAAATAEIDRAVAANPDSIVLKVIQARILNQVGKREEAREAIDAALAVSPEEPNLLAARAKLSGGEGLAFAEQALRQRPGDTDLLALTCQAALAAGDAERAAEVAARLVERRPLDQFFIALQATAWRLLGDPRYAEVYDYDRTTFVQQLDTPRGWSNLTSYISDLAAGLHEMHVLRAEPFGQSVRGGSQVTILSAKHPAVAAVQKALEAPIRQTLAAIAANGHPLGARNTGAWRYTGMWSVKLRSQGYHGDHVHPEGWLSSACYVELPPLPGHEGWLKFGEPGVALKTPLAPERFVEPAPGRLVLFPSYMWHGTVPFNSDKPRMTFAFDLVPN